MAENFIDFLLPTEHLVSVTIQGATKTAGGVLTLAGSLMSVIAFISERSHEVMVEFDRVEPITLLQMNNMRTAVGNRLTLETLEDSQSASALSNITASYNWFHAIWSRGKEGFDGYFASGNFNSSDRGKGGQRVSLVGEPFALTSRVQVIRTVLP